MSWTPPDQCGDCGAEVIWGVTENGKRMPVDPPRYPRDDETANLAVYTDHLRRVRVRVLRADRPLAAWEHRGMPHFATCPARQAQRAARAAAAESAGRHPSRRPASHERVRQPLELDPPRTDRDDELAARRRSRRQRGPRP